MFSKKDAQAAVTAYRVFHFEPVLFGGKLQTTLLAQKSNSQHFVILGHETIEIIQKMVYNMFLYENISSFVKTYNLIPIKSCQGNFQISV